MLEEALRQKVVLAATGADRRGIELHWLSVSIDPLH